MEYNVTHPLQIKVAEPLGLMFFNNLKQEGEHYARNSLRPFVDDVSFIIKTMTLKDEESTAMHYATSNGYNLLVEFVLETVGQFYPLLLGVHDNRGNTPLMSAVLSTKTDTVRLLIRCGADVNICNNFGETPLSKAIELQDYNMVELLDQCTSGLQWSERSFDNKSALRWAVENAYNQPRRFMCEQFEELRRECHDPSQVIERMHEEFSDVDSTRHDGRKILNLVLQRYLPLGDTDDEYMKCIELACANGDMDTLEAMLKTETVHGHQVRY